MQSQNNYQSQGIKDEQGQVQELDHLRKMFIGGLSSVTTEDSLRSFYNQWGEVIDVVVMRDPTTKRSRGFGFITYSDSSMVDKAQASRPHVIDGKNVDSKRALPRPEGQQRNGESSVKKIFVGGLKENHDEQSLQDHFMQFGNVVNVKILTDKTTGRKRGFAFLEFDDYDAVDKAVLHKNHTIKYVLVDVKKSVYKQELAKKFTGPQQGGIMGPGFMPQGGPAGGYQQQAAPYNSQPQYGYPAQVAPNAYNGWGGYAQHSAPGYQQAQPAAPQAAYNGWNAGYAQPSGHWAQNGYNAPSAAPAATAPTQSAPAANGWNGQSAQQNFGDYQQVYNGGPQKAGSLQGNRMNPYSVSSAPNYGTHAHGYVNMYDPTKRDGFTRSTTRHNNGHYDKRAN